MNGQLSVLNLLRNTKIFPRGDSEALDFSEERVESPPLTMEVVRLHTVAKRYGGQRHPRIEAYETLKKRKEIIECVTEISTFRFSLFTYSQTYRISRHRWRYVPPGSTIVYISHEWMGKNHPDPDGTQMYNLLLQLDRLQKRKRYGLPVLTRPPA